MGIILVASCSGPPGAGRQLGEDLGTFRLDAVEASNSCGPGALGSLERFGFDVELARADSELFWNGRVGGQVRGSLDFELEARVSVTVREASTARSSCAIVRLDRVSGRLRADAAGELSSLTGAMSYDFSSDADSACSLDDLVTVGLPLLPCSMSYVLEGRRTREPGADPE